MAETVVPTIMDIVESLGGSGKPRDVIEALLLLADVIQSGTIPEDEIEQAVSDWLDAHPEATTTVQDGSITAAKLNADLLTTSDVDALFD